MDEEQPKPLPKYYKRKPPHLHKKPGHPKGTKNKKKRPKKRGRKRFNHPKSFTGAQFVPYSMARYYIQNLLPPGTITTRLQYRSWYAENRIRWMPYDPNKVYKEWTSWNDFLGNTNSFEDNYIKKSQLKQQFLPFWEAVSLAQSLASKHNLTAAHQYRKFHKDNPTLVSSLPRAPNVYYADWMGWPTWLGKTTSATLLPKVHMEQYFIVLSHGPDLYSFHITTGGKEEARKIVETGTFVKAYVYEAECHDRLAEIVERNSEEDDGNTRFCYNINSIIYEIDVILVQFKG